MFIGINNNFVVRSKKRFSCERGHKHAVATHASPLLKVITSSQISEHDFPTPSSAQMVSQTNLKKKIEIQEHHPVASSLV